MMLKKNKTFVFSSVSASFRHNTSGWTLTTDSRIIVWCYNIHHWVSEHWNRNDEEERRNKRNNVRKIQRFSSTLSQTSTKTEKKSKRNWKSFHDTFSNDQTLRIQMIIKILDSIVSEGTRARPPTNFHRERRALKCEQKTRNFLVSPRRLFSPCRFHSLESIAADGTLSFLLYEKCIELVEH